MTTIDATVGETVLIEFDNRDAGTNHNLVVERTANGTLETGIALGPVLQQLEVTFTEPGEHEYWCEVHPDDMRGTIIVTG